jgi:hypothetical protein
MFAAMNRLRIAELLQLPVEERLRIVELIREASRPTQLRSRSAMSTGPSSTSVAPNTRAIRTTSSLGTKC